MTATVGRIRRAEADDVPEILGMIRDLAEYELLAEEAVATEEQLTAALFGDRPTVFAHVVEHTSADGDYNIGGFALWFLNFSTWVGRNGLYLEDLYVRPELRGHGYGKRLLSVLAQECVANDYGRFEWSVLDWNMSSRDFYESFGAKPMTGWIPYRISGESLARLAEADGADRDN